MRMQLMALLLSVPFAGVAVAQDTTKSQDPYRNQNPPQQNRDTSRMQGRQQMNDQTLLSHLHASNQKEIEAGQLAQRNASSSRAKQLGQRLVRDHQQADQRVTQLAQRLNITLQNPDSMDNKKMGHDDMRRGDTTNQQGQQQRDTAGQQGQFGQQKPMQGDQDQDPDKEARKRLQSLRGAEFDTAFARLMVRSHDRNIAMLERAVGQRSTDRNQQGQFGRDTTNQGQIQGRDTSGSQQQPQNQYPQSQQDQNQMGQPSQFGQGQQAQLSPEVRTLVMNLLPTLREHRRMAQQVLTGTNTSSLQ